jgi:tetratricopeptide (TPR) repeat protein
VEDAQAVIEDDPSEWTAHLVMAAAGLGAGGSSALPQIPVEQHIREVEINAPDSADAYSLRASLAPDAADQLRLLNRALELDPDHAEALRQRINVYYLRLKNYDAALQDCERLIIARPRSSQGYRMKARVLAARPDLQQALEALERAMQVDPKDPLNFYERGQVYRTMGRWTESVEDFARAIELDPGDALFHHGRAVAYNAAGEFKLALYDALKAIELQPDYRWAYEPLLDAYWKLERRNELLSAINQLRSRAEGWAHERARAWAYREIAERYRLLGDDRRAVEAAELAVEVHRGDFRNFVRRAIVRRTFGDENGFRADCDEAALVEISSPDEWAERAWGIGRDCRRFEQAAEEFTQVITQVPTWFEGYYGRGHMHFELFKFEEALADFDRAIELAPGNAELYNMRAYCYSALGQFENAVKERARLLEIDPYHVKGWSNYGLALYFLGKTEDALEAFSTALSLDPKNGFNSSVRGRVLAALGKCDEALDDLRRAAEFDPLIPATRANIAFAHADEMYYRCRDQADLDAALDSANFACRAAARGCDALGLVLFRRGEYGEAESMFTGTLGHGTTYDFVSAMCAWHIGDEVEARSLFAKAAAWQEKYRPNYQVLLWQRDEAAELLGIED